MKKGRRKTEWKPIENAFHLEKKRKHGRSRGEQNEKWKVSNESRNNLCSLLVSFSFSRRLFSPLRLLPMEELLMYSGARLVAPLLMEFPIFSFPSTRLCSSFPCARSPAISPTPPSSVHTVLIDCQTPFA